MFSESIIESSLILESSEPVVVVYDCESGKQRIHFAGNSADLGLLSPATSMAVGNNGVIWVSNGSFIKSFALPDLSSLQTITTGAMRAPRSSAVFWNGNLSVACGSTVLSWSSQLLEEGDMNESSCNVRLNLTHSITSLATVGENLVVASAEHHTAPVYAPNGARVARALGHCAGVTALAPYDRSRFLSGSADQTARLWDVGQQAPVLTFRKHHGIVTALFGDPFAQFVLTGGTDGLVKGWDVRRDGKALFSVPVGDGAPQSIHYGTPKHKLTVVVSERTADMFYDMQKFGGIQGPERLSDAPSSGVLSFMFALP
jgi:WD40 repeat protein